MLTTLEDCQITLQTKISTPPKKEFSIHYFVYNIYYIYPHTIPISNLQLYFHLDIEKDEYQFERQVYRVVFEVVTLYPYVKYIPHMICEFSYLIFIKKRNEKRGVIFYGNKSWQQLPYMMKP